MIAILNFATLVAVTVFSVAAAYAFEWLLLRVMFVLMRPATARRLAVPPPATAASMRLAKSQETGPWVAKHQKAA